MTPHLTNALAVGIAGFAGAMARYYVQALGVRVVGTGFPWATLFINVSGSFVLGWFMTMAAWRWEGVSDATRLAVAVGFLGAYTTFSTWAYDSWQQIARGEWGWAALNLVGSLVLGLAAVWAGIACAGGQK